LLGEAESGPAIAVDHAMPDEGREDSGPSPMELVLIGLCGCTGMDVISILRKKRQSFTDLRVEATAERAEDHPRVYTMIHLEYVVSGDVTPEALERSIELSQAKYCSVSAMLSQTAEISTSYRIVGQDE
jgi:putative redox protein